MKNGMFQNNRSLEGAEGAISEAIVAGEIIISGALSNLYTDDKE